MKQISEGSLLMKGGIDCVLTTGKQVKKLKAQAASNPRSSEGRGGSKGVFLGPTGPRGESVHSGEKSGSVVKLARVEAKKELEKG